MVGFCCYYHLIKLSLSLSSWGAHLTFTHKSNLILTANKSFALPAVYLVEIFTAHNTTKNDDPISVKAKIDFKSFLTCFFLHISQAIVSVIIPQTTAPANDCVFAHLQI